VTDFERLLDNFGRKREVLGEAEEAGRISSANRLRREAQDMQAEILRLWDEAQATIWEYRDRDAVRDML
jgi:hypothetical protein